MKITEVYKKTIVSTLLLACFLGFSSSARRSRRQNARPNTVFRANCYTPDARPGRCIRLSSCSELRQDDSNDRVRQYICGFGREEPRVCCPKPGEEMTTRRPVRATVRTTTRPTGGRPGPGTTERLRSGTKPSFLPGSCGVKDNTLNRVVGGSPAEKGSWPWMAVLFERRNDGTWIPASCGGALVTNQHVVTAAHCVVGRRSAPLDPSKIMVRLGAHDLSIPNEPDAVDVDVEEVRRHEQYEARTYKNDIAVLKLKRPVTFTPAIAPVCLPYDSLRDEDLTGKSVTVIGYGTTVYNGDSSNVLMQAAFYILSKEVCNTAYEHTVKDSDVYMCAGVTDGSKDACQGDSGGPLLTTGRNNNYYLIGVVSSGKECGLPNYPGIYTNVPSFLDWLSANLSH